MRILIADDNDLVRRGIRVLLSSVSDYEVCGEASDGGQALQKTRDLLPDVVLLDISMPVSDGFETARLIKQEFPDVKILIMSQNDETQLLPSALQCGANGCLDKTHMSDKLISAIKSI